MSPSRESSIDGLDSDINARNFSRLYARRDRGTRTALHALLTAVFVTVYLLLTYLLILLTYIAVFFEVGHFPAGRFHHLERDPGVRPGPCVAPQTTRVADSWPPRGGAHSLSRRRNDLLPLSLRRASPAAPCTRCATTVCAAARRAQPH